MAQRVSIPATPDEVTPAWLTAVLGEVGVPRETAVAAVDWTSIGEEQGFTGVVARLHVRYAGGVPPASAPSTLVAKFPTATRTVPSAYRTAQERDAATARRHYERCAREVAFYRELAPHGSAPAPRFYHGAADDASSRIVLILEDVADARSGDVLAGCSSAEAALVLDAMAPFHARWWKNAGADMLSWLPRWSGDRHTRQERYARQVDPFLDRFGARLPPPIRATVEGLRQGYAGVLVALDRAPATVIHADLHLDNVLFALPDAERPAIVLDWQSVARGAAVVDVAFFVIGSLAPEQRRAVEDDMLRRYHASLAGYGVTGYPLERLRADYRLALLSLLAGTVGWLGGAEPDQLTGRERALVEAAIGDGRLIGALLDHDAARLVDAIA